MFHKYRVTAFIVILVLHLAKLGHADWDRFRGPNGTGICPDATPTPVKWSDKDNLRWKVALPGRGSSSPIVVGDDVFVTCWTGYGTDPEELVEQSLLRRHLICLNRHNGETRWSKTVEPFLPEDEYSGMFTQNGFASHTPVSDGERVYVFFGKTGALAFDRQGKQLWKHSVGTESDPQGWGSASSPIVYNDLLIVTASAESEALVGLNKLTGEEVWRQETSGLNAVWGTPVLVRIDDERTDLVIAVPEEIWGLNPATGKLRWYCEALGVRSFCSSVVAHGGVIYAVESGPGGGGGIAVRAGGKGDLTETHVVWRGRQSNRIGTPIAHDGYLYTFSNRVVNCLDLKSGAKVFSSRLTASRPDLTTANPGRDNQLSKTKADAEFQYFRESDDRLDSERRRRGRSRRGGFHGQDYSSPVLADGKIYFVSRSGDIFVLKADTDFQLLAVNRLTKESEDFSASPAISDGQILIRSSSSLYCIASQ